MRLIALSLLLIFSTFTVVLSTYYLWQDADFQVAMPIEEEEDHSNGKNVPFKDVDGSDRDLINLLADEKSKAVSNLDVRKNYEDVYINTPTPPPDVT